MTKKHWMLLDNTVCARRVETGIRYTEYVQWFTSLILKIKSLVSYERGDDLYRTGGGPYVHCNFVRGHGDPSEGPGVRGEDNRLRIVIASTNEYTGKDDNQTFEERLSRYGTSEHT